VAGSQRQRQQAIWTLPDSTRDSFDGRQTDCDGTDFSSPGLLAMLHNKEPPSGSAICTAVIAYKEGLVGGVFAWLAGHARLSCLDLRQWITIGVDNPSFIPTKNHVGSAICTAVCTTRHSSFTNHAPLITSYHVMTCTTQTNTCMSPNTTCIS
jgi:hypothetical protein